MQKLTAKDIEAMRKGGTGEGAGDPPEQIAGAAAPAEGVAPEAGGEAPPSEGTPPAPDPPDPADQEEPGLVRLIAPRGTTSLSIEGKPIAISKSGRVKVTPAVAKTLIGFYGFKGA